jgi:hypothetical protein
LQNQKVEWIGRNILKIDSQLENNNQKHWKAKRVMPFQGRESDLGLHCFFVQPFRFLFCAKGFNSPPAHSNPSQAARAHCSGVTQPTGQCSSRGLFLNRALLHCSFQAVLHCVKAEFGFREIQMAARPGYGMAASGAGGGLRQTFNTSDQVRPRQEFSSYTVKINLVCQGGYARSVVV